MPVVDLNVTDARFYDDPRDAVEWLHREGPLYFVDARPDYPHPLWLVGTWEDVRTVKSDADLFTTRYGTHLEEAMMVVDEGIHTPAFPPDPWLEKCLRTMIFRDPPDHRRIRKVMSPSFSRRHVDQQWAGLAASATNTVLDKIEPGSIVEFTTLTAELALRITCGLLGVDSGRSDDYIRWASAIMESLEPGATTDWDTIYDMMEFVKGEIERREGHPAGDLLSDLIAHGLATGEMDKEEIIVSFWEVLSGGIETSSQLQSGGLASLLEHPDQMALLAADRSLIPRAIEELLRWVTPIRYNTRVTTRDTTLHDVEIAAGDLVMTNYFFANRDPRAFPDPWTLDVTRGRSQHEHLSFGYGPHHCIGAHLARIEAIAFFDGLFARGWKLELVEVPVCEPSTLMSGYKRVAVAVS